MLHLSPFLAGIWGSHGLSPTQPGRMVSWWPRWSWESGWCQHPSHCRLSVAGPKTSTQPVCASLAKTLATPSIPQLWPFISLCWSCWSCTTRSSGQLARAAPSTASPTFHDVSVSKQWLTRLSECRAWSLLAWQRSVPHCLACWPASAETSPSSSGNKKRPRHWGWLWASSPCAGCPSLSCPPPGPLSAEWNVAVCPSGWSARSCG